MRIGLSTLCALAAAALACCGTALGNPSLPGTPGTPSCYGQTIAFLNHSNRTDFGVHGLGNIAAFSGISVPETQATASGFCAVP
jgi:hypothetical protein